MSRGKPGFGNMGGMQQLMQQAQKMQQSMEKVREEVGAREMEFESGGGLVKIKMNGKLELLEMKLKKDCVDPDDVEMLQDLVKKAVNEAIKQSREIMDAEMAKVSGGLNLPGVF